MNPTYCAIAADPRVIPGVHHHCDEWCDYCGVTGRCLAFRCTVEYRKAHGRDDGEDTFATIDEAVEFTREVAAAEGQTTRELDELVGHAPGESAVRTDDRLAALAWNYGVRAAMLLGPAALAAAMAPPRAAGPTPDEVITWYQLRIYMRVFRACVARERPGRSSYEDEALGSAKLALLSVAASRSAWRSLAGARDVAEVACVVALLDAIERGLEERFPKARAFVRLGLDVPVV